MINQVSCVPMSFCQRVGVTSPIHFRASTCFKGTTPNTKPQNLIEEYLIVNGYYNRPMVKSAVTATKTPSGVDKYENYVECDSTGKEITSVIYTKNGNELVQTAKVVSPDGSTVERVATKDKDMSKFQMTIRDEKGNILMERSKSHKKLGNDRAQTIINGQIYNISGLTENYIKIEHNGEVGVISMDKLITDSVLVLQGEEGKTCVRTERDKKITSSERKVMESKIRNLPADDLIRLAKSVEVVRYLEEREGFESFFDNSHGTSELHLGKAIDSSTTLHELGHAINHIDESNIKSNNEHLKNIKDYETSNLLRKYNDNVATDIFTNMKFADYENMMKVGMNKDEALTHLRDEVFAEGYSVLNNVDIFDINQFMQARNLGLMKYYPKTLAQIANLY